MRKKNQMTKEKKRRLKHRLLSKATPTERAPRRKTQKRDPSKLKLIDGKK